MSYNNCSECSDSSGEDSDENNFDDCKDEDCIQERNYNCGLWDRIIVHLDVDCFYCQCEELDGPPCYRERPLAIGQKHIIVTSNYLARKSGVKKLQSRDDALIACPNLLILEGSDLERYRQHSRKVYNSFRDGLCAIAKECNANVSVQKGGMDECFADVTNLLKNFDPPKTFFVFGDNSSFQSHLVEDQSGATSIIRLTSSIASSEENVHEQYSGDRSACQKRLHAAASLCEGVREKVKQETGFSTTIGISVSKLLSKLASDLKKPDSLNILYPWRSSSVLLPMPLRKIPELGSRTFHLLETCLQNYHGKKPTHWTCKDLIQVPVYQISSVFKDIKHTEEASHQLFMKFRDRCRGLDTTIIVDDVGGLSKQVSVEDSFRRGTLTTIEAAKTVLRQLIDRIERLLDDRQINSLHPSQAYPITIRVTARVVDPNNASIRRPFKTTSKQCPFNGKLYMKSNQVERQRMLQAIVEPLLTRLVMQNHGDPRINLTRLNLAMSNFQDINWKSAPETETTNQILSQQGKNISNSFFKLSLPAKRDFDALIAKTIHVDKSVMTELPRDIALEVRWIDQIPKTRAKQPRIDTFFPRK